jgi:hypothetical protein
LLLVAPYCFLAIATSPNIPATSRLKFVSELVKVFVGRVEVPRAHLEVLNRRCSTLPIDERRRVRDCYDGKEFIAPCKTRVLQFVFIDIPRIPAA